MAVVVAGCGAAGAEFVRLFADSGYDTVVVSPSSLLVCQAMLPAYVAGRFEDDDVCIDLKPFFREAGVRFRKGRVKFVKPRCSTLFVNYRTLRGIGYEFAVIAVGGESCYYGIEGADKCLSVNTLEEARVTRKKVRSGDEVVVVGSGMTGVETAYELAELCRVRLVEAESRVLPAMCEKVSGYVQKLLESRGVEVLTSCRVQEISHENGIIRTSRGELSFDEIIWCAGIKGRNMPGLDYGRTGIRVDESLRATSNIFAIGDCADISFNGAAATKTALEAERQARFVAGILKKRDSSLAYRPYRPFSTDRNPFAILTFGERGVIVRGNLVLMRPAKVIYRLKKAVMKKFLENYRI